MLILVILLGALWGSFLNVVAFRLINNQSIVTPRSRCTKCRKTIAWYDNIPVISWLLLHATCRWCSQPISCLYPFIELVTSALFATTYLIIDPSYWISYFIFFSALIVIIRTDLEYMLIIPEFCLYPGLYALIASYVGLLPISLTQSIIGALIGYFSLWSIATIHYCITKRQGLGEGDFDLLALIGAFTGPEGILLTLLIASWSGTIIAGLYLLATGNKLNARIPFPPLLALGAAVYVLVQPVNLLYHL